MFFVSFLCGNLRITHVLFHIYALYTGGVIRQKDDIPFFSTQKPTQSTTEPKKYINNNDYLEKYNVFVPEANGSGALGEVLSTPLIGQPLIGHTDTFLSIGAFDNEEEAKALLKYIKTKFARAMLGVKKATQHNPKSTWQFVPLQDFTANSDIDWSKSIPEIDRQLYKKYNLSPEEIDFIETHVKEMD